MTQAALCPGVAQRLAQFQARLAELSDERTKAWFESYLKGMATYRGVRTPTVTRELKAWLVQSGASSLPAGRQLNLCRKLVQSEYCEDKFAAFIWIQTRLIDELAIDDLLGEAQLWLESGWLSDWSTNDWFSVRVMQPAFVRHGLAVRRRLEWWASEEDVWRRRASIVPFRAVVDDERYHPSLRRLTAKLVTDERRFVQTALGWVLADLSKVYPDVADELFDRYFGAFLPEVIRRHTKHLPRHEAFKARLSQET